MLPKKVNLAIVITYFAQHAWTHPACEQSGYCSLGLVQPFFGDIFPSVGLQQALQARSFKQEVIIMVSDDKMLDSFLQGSNSFARLGMGHILLLSYSEAMCTTINSIVPDVGCAWSSFEEPPDLQDVYYLWSFRYRTLARSLRLGYNVLLVDSDTAVFDDPYKYFKQPPFQDIVVLNQEESPVEANGGNLYVQNAAPDGPAVFMFAEIISRPLRWADDGWETASKHKLRKQCLYADQDAYADVLPDMASGYMLFPKALWCVDEDSRAQADWQELDDNTVKAIRWSERYNETKVTVPEDWQQVVGGSETALKTLQLRMPNCRGWPEEFGGEWYPKERGKYSTAFLQQLQQDRPDTPLWLDPEDAANAAAADKVPTEKFALMPRWVGCSWTWRGKAGYWDPNITGNVAQQVIGHTHAIPDGNRAMAKRVVPQSLGIYDWELALKANKQKPYFACTGFDCTDLRVLAFTPTMEQLLADTASWLEFSLLLQGLAQLGQLLGRAVAWPSLPCKTAWINPAFIIKRRHEVPLKLGELWLPWNSPAGELTCTPWEYVQQPCLEAGRGLLPWEWQRFQDVHLGNAGTHNDSIDKWMIRATHSGNETHADDQQGFTFANHIVEVEDAMSLPEELQMQPILFLDSLVHADMAAWPEQPKAAFKQMQSACLVLNPELYLSKYTLAGEWRKPEDTRDVTESVHRPARLKKGRLHRYRHTAFVQE